MGVMFGECGGDCHPNAFRIPKHVIVPEAQNPVALAFEKPSPFSLRLGCLVMLPAIDFDDHGRKLFVTGLMTAELIGEAPINPVRSKRRSRKSTKRS